MDYRIVVTTAVLAMAAAACGDDTGGTAGGGGAPGAGGAGGAGSTTTSTTATTSTTNTTTTTSSGGGEGGGTGGAGDGGSGTGGDPGAGGAGGGTSIALACEGATPLVADGTCAPPIDAEQWMCNPITNEGCEDGGACDFAYVDEAFETIGTFCFPPPLTQEVCEECNGNALFCQAGMTCTQYWFPPEVEIGCAEFCCSDDDCETGVCAAIGILDAEQVGVCLAAQPG